MRRGWAYIVIFVSLGCISTYGAFKSASAQVTSPWIVSDAPQLNKITDLPANVTPDKTNVDCAQDLARSSDGTTQSVCTFASPLGTLGSGTIQIGQEKYVALMGPTNSSVFLPTVSANIAVLAMGSSMIGNYIGVYHHLSKSALTYHRLSEQGQPYYDVSDFPDQMLRNPATQELLAVDAGSIAYSANGEWMVADLPHRGLVRVHMTDLSVKLFAGPLEPSWYLGVASPPLAISNDGRYVAANGNIFSNSNITLYDTESCDDQLNITANQQYCRGKELFNGNTATGQPLGMGLLAGFPGLQSPTHFRFVNDDSLSFYARYDVTSALNYKVGSFVATAPGSVAHDLGLLGMGDSYISGQGEFSYRYGTDTTNNICHLSELSYPFLLGSKHFNSFNSVACSGAVTDDLFGSDQNFQGQVRDQIEEKNRDKQSILSNFSPGYIYQQEFASTYTPETIVLSVGGDDVGFADIVKRCVANSGGNDCYDTYEDRLELANQIDGIYGKLVNTYKTLREQSGGARLYVVGYPQIVKPDGDCGVNVHLSSSETEFSATLISYLNSVISQAAASAGIFYVNTEHAFDGYRLCEPGEKAVNGLTAGNDAGIVVRGKTYNFIGAESYHPTQLGHTLLASTIDVATKGLSANMPRPTSYTPPALDVAAPLLQGVPKSGRPVKQVVADAELTNDTKAVPGDTVAVQANGNDLPLQPNAPYQVVLHSDPILLKEGSVNADGAINTLVTLPETVPPGFHVVHVYTTDMAGEDVDLQKTIYVAAVKDSPDDIVGGPTSATVTSKLLASATIHAAASLAPVTYSNSSTPVESKGKAVLGDQIAAGKPKTLNSIGQIAVRRPLYRVNWFAVLGIGCLLSFGFACGSYALKRN